MSKLYATINADNGRSVTTRRAHHEVAATAQSWDGSVQVSLGYDELTESLGVRVCLDRGSDANPNCHVWGGTFTQFAKLVGWDSYEKVKANS